jgi:hypothetical protein
MDSVMTRLPSVRCGKWRSGVEAPGRCARIMRPFASPVKGVTRAWRIAANIAKLPGLAAVMPDRRANYTRFGYT